MIQWYASCNKLLPVRNSLGLQVILLQRAQIESIRQWSLRPKVHCRGPWSAEYRFVLVSQMLKLVKQNACTAGSHWPASSWIIYEFSVVLSPLLKLLTRFTFLFFVWHNWCVRSHSFDIATFWAAVSHTGRQNNQAGDVSPDKIPHLKKLCVFSAKVAAAQELYYRYEWKKPMQVAWSSNSTTSNVLRIGCKRNSICLDSSSNGAWMVTSPHHTVTSSPTASNALSSDSTTSTTSSHSSRPCCVAPARLCVYAFY